MSHYLGLLFQDEKKPVAIKVIQRSRIGKQDKLLGKEVEILKKLKERIHDISPLYQPVTFFSLL